MALAPGRPLATCAEGWDKAIDILEDLLYNEMRIFKSMIRRGSPGQAGPAARGFAREAFSSFSASIQESGHVEYW